MTKCLPNECSRNTGKNEAVSLRCCQQGFTGSQVGAGWFLPAFRNLK